jgi:solute carrier family 25 (mitochondrial phosphate transporter), member 3
VEKERDLDSSVFWRFAACGAVCCSTAHAFLIPLDVVKTKMQADPNRYRTVLESTKEILKEGGPQGLMLGAGATIIGYLVYGGVSFGLTELFKRLFLEVAGPEFATFYPFAILLLASMSAAFFGAVAVTPFEALRIRSVTTPGFKQDLVGSFVQVAQEGSLTELFAGLGPAVIGEIPFMMTKFAIFDAVSRAIYANFPGIEESVGWSLAVSLLSGMTAGVAAAVVSHPFDTLTTRVTQFSQLKRGGGVVAAVQDIWVQGGLQGFFKGTVPRAVKSAANIALQFFLYDFLKRALHVSADDLKLFFDVMSGLEIAGTTTPGGILPPQL